MLIAPPHPQEKLRLLELQRLLILDSEPEAIFDRLVEVARSVAGCSIGLISLVDSDRQWFKSRCGLDAEQTPRDVAFCSHTILIGRPLIVENALLDERFADNPLVVGEPGIRFYAGFPLISRSLLPLGTLCLIDQQPRTLQSEQLQQLQGLADEVVSLFEMRRRSLALEVSQLTHQCLELVVNDAGTIVLAHGSLEGTACATSTWEGRPLLEQVPLAPDVVEKLRNRPPEQALGLSVELELTGTPESAAQIYRLEVMPIGPFNALLEGLSLVRVRRPNALEIGLEKRGEFLQMLTHEVNTPLAIVRGNLHRLQNRQPNEPLVVAANQEARRMSRLFDRLVVLARLDEMLQSQLPQSLHASELIQHWWNAAPGETQRRVRLSYSGNRAHHDLKLTLEPQVVSALLGELVDNALRFSEPHTPIDVVLRGSLEAGQLSLLVVDQGPGLDPEVLAAGFKAFRKSELGRRADRPEGSGLGLHLVATVVSRLQGSLHFHRIPQGTAVQIQLPLATPGERQGASAGATPELASPELTPCRPELEQALSRLLV